MTTFTDTELKELIDELDKNFALKLAGLENKVDTGLVRIEEQLKAINENLKDIKQQTEKQDNRFWSLVLALFVALFGAVAKVWFFSGNP